MLVQKYFYTLFSKRSLNPVLFQVLKFFSRLFRAAIRARHLAYDRGWISSYYASIPVFSVGNIAVGGTGKTPLVQLLAQELGKEAKIGILSRGFKAKLKSDILQISEGQGPLFSQARSGDEPFLLAGSTPASIWIGKNRVKAAKQAQKAGMRALILDDGMQHRRLERDVEIVVIDALNPLSDEEFLPAGKLRDEPKRLMTADLIFLTHVQDDAHYEKVVNLLRNYTEAPCVGTRHRFLNSELSAGKKVSAFCGIGNPSYFYDMIRGSGADLVETLTLPDHAAPTSKAFSSFMQKSCLKEATCVLCTEKDAVKMHSLPPFSIPVIPMKMELEITQGKEHWNLALEKMKQKVVV